MDQLVDRDGYTSSWFFGSAGVNHVKCVNRHGSCQKKITPPDFQAKRFTPSISPIFNSFSKKKTQTMSENGDINTAGKNFTLPPAVTAVANLTSGVYFLLLVNTCF